jgi:hypothetical protein
MPPLYRVPRAHAEYGYTVTGAALPATKLVGLNVTPCIKCTDISARRTVVVFSNPSKEPARSNSALSGLLRDLLSDLEDGGSTSRYQLKQVARKVLLSLVSCLTSSAILKMEEVRFSERSAKFYQIVWRTSQKIVLFVVTAMRTSHQTWFCLEQCHPIVRISVHFLSHKLPPPPSLVTPSLCPALIPVR